MLSLWHVAGALPIAEPCQPSTLFNMLPHIPSTYTGWANYSKAALREKFCSPYGMLWST